MKIQLTTLALAFVATAALAASADDVYRGFAEGNPDISEPHPVVDANANRTANRGGDKFDFHQGLSSPDLSPPPRTPDATVKRSESGYFDFHQGLYSPDLSPPPPAM